MNAPAQNVVPAACAAHREDLICAAAGIADAEQTARLQPHLEACPACAREAAELRLLMETVRRASGPETPVDTERVLTILRRRWEEDRAARPTLNRARLKNFLLIAFCLLAILLAGLAFFHEDSPMQSEAPFAGRLRVAVYAPDWTGAQTEILRAGDERTAGAAHAAARFEQGAELILRRGSRVVFRSSREVELSAGSAALEAPSFSGGFLLRGRLGKVWVESGKGARLILESGPGGETLWVLEGSVLWEDRSRRRQETAAGQRLLIAADGTCQGPTLAESREATAWMAEGLAQLKAELRVGGGEGRETLYLGLRNTGPEGVDVAGFHGLGPHYQLELLRPGARSCEFAKPAPRALRRRGPQGETPLGEHQGLLRLEPGETYELEVPAAIYLSTPGTYRFVFHYLCPGAGPRHNWAVGFLRSEEAVVQVKP